MAGGADEGEDVRHPLRRQRRVHGEEDIQDQGEVPAGESVTSKFDGYIFMSSYKFYALVRKTHVENLIYVLPKQSADNYGVNKYGNSRSRQDEFYLGAKSSSKRKFGFRVLNKLEKID